MRRLSGYSLIEMLIAIALALSVAGVIFQLFVRNRAVFHDQELILEMHQSARAVGAMIAGDIRRAGQGVPLFAASHQPGPATGVESFLAGTQVDQLQIRTQARVPDTLVIGPAPFSFGLGTSTSIRTRDPNPLLAPGDHVFLWGEAAHTWTWLRARVDVVYSTTDFALTPVQVSQEGGAFSAAPQVAMEDAVSYRLSGRSILRGELRDLSSPGSPLFRESSIGDDFTTLQFVYYDGAGLRITPTTLSERSGIRRVDFLLEAETSGPLSNGGRRTHVVTMSVGPRNPALD